MILKSLKIIIFKKNNKTEFKYKIKYGDKTRKQTTIYTKFQLCTK